MKPLIPSMGRPQDYKTYAIRSPLGTHSRRATCAEVNCEAFQNGWTIPKANLSDRDIHLIRQSGRQYQEVYGNDYGVGEGRFFVFAPGQPCFRFQSHRVSLDRDPFFFVGRGYLGLNTHTARQHRKADDWRDDMAQHLDGIRTIRERG
jgi:hypothetical protein